MGVGGRDKEVRIEVSGGLESVERREGEGSERHS